MNQEDKHILVERYLEGELNSEELSAFQSSLQADAELQRELDLSQKARKALELHNRILLEEQIRRIDQKNRKSTFFKPSVYWLAAASLLLVAAVGLVVFAGLRYSNQSLYASYYTPASDHLTTMGDENSDFDKGMNAYNQERYEEAGKYFEAIPPSDIQHEQAVFFLAMVHMALEKYDDAQKLLATIVIPELKPEALWYSALCYLKLNRQEEAYTELEVLKSMGYREKEVTELLKKLDNPFRKLVF